MSLLSHFKDGLLPFYSFLFINGIKICIDQSFALAYQTNSNPDCREVQWVSQDLSSHKFQCTQNVKRKRKNVTQTKAFGHICAPGLIFSNIPSPITWQNRTYSVVWTVTEEILVVFYSRLLTDKIYFPAMSF